MTWIKTIPISESDEKLRRVTEAQRELYHEAGVTERSIGGTNWRAAHNVTSGDQVRSK